MKFKIQQDSIEVLNEHHRYKYSTGEYISL